MMKSLTEPLSFKEVFIQYLLEQKSTIINEWTTAICIQKYESYKENIIDYANKMFNFILEVIQGSLKEEELKLLANKVAKERVEKNANIGQFLNNVNIGRSIIVKYVFELNIISNEIKEIINEINILFDTYNYFTVTRYTCLKNKVIEEKDFFIHENHKDKLVLLGQISSSFIHEFRNPLTSIMGFTKLLRRENPQLHYLDIIDQELQQLNFRIAQFLHTSRAEFNIEGRERVSIKEVWYEIEQLTYSSIVDANIYIEIDLPSDFYITACKVEIKQVLLNLLINSIDALRYTNHPRRVKIHGFTLSEELVIQVSNNGPAIPHISIEYIFEPFYTTKELGTGIGLYVCKKIIEYYKGYMKCTSNEELTTFSIHFPISE